MNTSISNLRVFVSDEIFDFRTLHGENMIDKTKIRTQSTCKWDLEGKTNENEIQAKAKKQKLRPRSRTVDPRFRRSRSPTLQNATQSTNTINKLLKPRATQHNRSTSISSPTINNQACLCKDTQLRRNCNKIEVPKKEEMQRLPTIITEKELNLMEGNDCSSSLNWEKPKKDTSDNGDASFASEVQSSHNIQYHETDSHVTRNDKTDYSDILNSLLLDHHVAFTKNLQKKPYWEDPRYLTRGKSKNSTTNANMISLTKKPIDFGTVFCHVLPTTTASKDFTAYKYDQGSEAYTCSLVHDDDRQSGFIKSEYDIWNNLRSVLCSITGILLVSLIVWIILNFNLENEQTQPVKEPDNIIVYYYNKIIEYIKNNLEGDDRQDLERQRMYLWNSV